MYKNIFGSLNARLIKIDYIVHSVKLAVDILRISRFYFFATRSFLPHKRCMYTAFTNYFTFKWKLMNSEKLRHYVGTLNVYGTVKGKAMVYYASFYRVFRFDFYFLLLTNFISKKWKNKNISVWPKVWSTLFKYAATFYCFLVYSLIHLFVIHLLVIYLFGYYLFIELSIVFTVSCRFYYFRLICLLIYLFLLKN